MTTNLSLLYHSMAILHKHLYGYVVFIMLKPYAVRVIYGTDEVPYGMIASSEQKESTVGEVELALTTGSISNGTRDLSALTEVGNLNLLFISTYDNIEVH